MLTEKPVFSSYSIDTLESALAFYRDTLGLDVVQTPEGLRLNLVGGTVFLYQKADHVPATFTVLNFQVDDIDAEVGLLQQKGISFERFDMGEMTADEKGIYRGKASGNGPDIAWFKDPAGNILSIVEGQ